MSLCLCYFVFLFFCLSLCLSVSQMNSKTWSCTLIMWLLRFCLFLCLSISLFHLFSVSLSPWLSVSLSLYLSIFLSVSQNNFTNLMMHTDHVTFEVPPWAENFVADDALVHFFSLFGLMSFCLSLCLCVFFVSISLCLAIRFLALIDFFSSFGLPCNPWSLEFTLVWKKSNYYYFNNLT
jgi:hypothetical protein